MKKHKEMNCMEIHTDLLHYAEGSLSGNRKRIVEEHLAACSSCNKYFAFLRDSLNHIETEKQYTPDPFLYTRVKARMEREKKESGSAVIQMVTRLSAAAVILLAIAGGITLGRLYSGYIRDNNQLMSKEVMYIDELKQETVESFLLTINEKEDE